MHNILSNEFTQIRGEEKEIRTYFNSFDCYLLLKIEGRKRENKQCNVEMKKTNSGGFEFVEYLRPRVLTESDIEKRI